MTGSVTFTPDEGDYVGAMCAHFGRSLRRPKAIRALLILSAIFAVIGAGMALVNGATAWLPVYVLAGALYGAVLIGAIWLGNALLLPRRARKMFAQQRSIQQQFEYRWSESGLEWSDARGGRGVYLWADLHGWYETDAAFLIYMNDMLFQFLPQRALGPERAGDLRRTLTQSGLAVF